MPLAFVTPRYVLEIALFAVCYFLAAHLGLQLATVATQISEIWPATGVALAILTLRGRRLWPAVLLGAVAANIESGAPWYASTGIAVGNVLEAVAGATLLSLAEFRPSMKRLRDVAALFVLAAGLSTLVSATIGVLTLCVSVLIVVRRAGGPPP